MGRKKNNFLPAACPRTLEVSADSEGKSYGANGGKRFTTPQKAVTRVVHHGEATTFEYVTIKTSNAGRFAVWFQNANGVSCFKMKR